MAQQSGRVLAGMTEALGVSASNIPKTRSEFNQHSQGPRSRPCQALHPSAPVSEPIGTLLERSASLGWGALSVGLRYSGYSGIRRDRLSDGRTESLNFTMKTTG